MGLKHEAKKGTVIEANRVTVKVLRGSSQLEITAPPEVPITIGHVSIDRANVHSGKRQRPKGRDRPRS